jgi:hypothetical protein
MVLDDKLHWYKDAIIYELHIKAFYDSNGDGIGDFAGLLQKLDYLQELGVTAIWLLPFYPSPLRDDGYDIADYYTINQRYGNIEEFKQFLDEAHKRNLKVITELVVNHTSDQHPWFQRARRAPKGSPERDYYVWSDHLYGLRSVQLDLGPCSATILLAPLFSSPAGPEFRQPTGARGDHQGFRLLVLDGCGWLPAGCHPLPV